MVNVRKRDKYYQYQFEVAPINGNDIRLSGSKSTECALTLPTIAININVSNNKIFLHLLICFSPYFSFIVIFILTLLSNIVNSFLLFYLF